MSDAIGARVAGAVYRQSRARDTVQRILGAAGIAIDGTTRVISACTMTGSSRAW